MIPPHDDILDQDLLTWSLKIEIQSLTPVQRSALSLRPDMLDWVRNMLWALYLDLNETMMLGNYRNQIQEYRDYLNHAEKLYQEIKNQN